MTDNYVSTAPSDANRWVRCNGAAYMQSKYPRTETHPTTELGKAAHWAADRVINSWLPVNSLEPVSIYSLLNEICPENGVVLDEELITAADVYLNEIWARTHLHVSGIRTECKLGKLPNGQGAGRADLLWLSEDGRELLVIDGKFGFSSVEAVWNYQLAIYALACISESVQWVTMLVIQPRGVSARQPVKEWRVEASFLKGEIWQRISGAYEHTKLGPQSPTRAGSHCRWCRAAAHCSTLGGAIYTAQEMPGTANPEELDEAQVAYELDTLSEVAGMVRARQDAMKGLAIDRIQKGKAVPSYEVSQNLGDRSWRDPDSALTFGLLFGEDLSRGGVISPAQAQARGIPKSVIDTQCERTPGAAQLRRIKS